MQVLRAQLRVEPDPSEVGRARVWARARLAGAGVHPEEPVAESLVLIISELVTNAVVHTGRSAVVRLVVTGRTSPSGAHSAVRVEVVDASVRAPAPRHAEQDDTSGRGLELVEGLADRWGWHREGGGKRIWCELDRGAPHDPAPGRVSEPISAVTAPPCTDSERRATDSAGCPPPSWPYRAERYGTLCSGFGEQPPVGMRPAQRCDDPDS